MDGPGDVAGERNRLAGGRGEARQAVGSIGLVLGDVAVSGALSVAHHSCVGDRLRACPFPHLGTTRNANARVAAMHNDIRDVRFVII